MATFAKLGINGKVIAVHSVSDADCLNADGKEDESVGIQFTLSKYFIKIFILRTI